MGNIKVWKEELCIEEMKSKNKEKGQSARKLTFKGLGIRYGESQSIYSTNELDILAMSSSFSFNFLIESFCS